MVFELSARCYQSFKEETLTLLGLVVEQREDESTLKSGLRTYSDSALKHLCDCFQVIENLEFLSTHWRNEEDGNTYLPELL